VIDRKTVIILGAGAVQPYGFPTGPQLRDSVLRLGSPTTGSLHPALGLDQTDFKQFIRDLRFSGHPSVDAFLEHNPNWLDAGKKAISLELLRCEHRQRERLFPPHQPRDHWLEELWARLKAPTWTKFKRNPVAFVTFNYDRCLEHYLLVLAIMNYRIAARTALDALAKLPLIHVHGSLGEYCLIKGGRRFGNEVTDKNTLTASRSIKIVSENEGGDSPEFERVRALCQDADRILFAGFGFHADNMRRLGFRSKDPHSGALLKTHHASVHCTHRGFKARSWAKVCDSYGFSPHAGTYGAGTISEFIRETLR
jgi:hypothetical protein